MTTRDCLLGCPPMGVLQWSPVVFGGLKRQSGRDIRKARWTGFSCVFSNFGRVSERFKEPVLKIFLAFLGKTFVFR